MSKESAPARTRGGWEPSGTAAARRSAHGARVTAKGARTREELVAAARRVFERDGYSSARVADIAAAAGVAHGSFYTYFASKQDVFLAVMHQVGEQFEEAVAPLPAGRGADPYQALDQANRRYLAAYRANSVIWALVEQVSTVDPEIHRSQDEAEILRDDAQHRQPSLTGGREVPYRRRDDERLMSEEGLQHEGVDRADQGIRQIERPALAQRATRARLQQHIIQNGET